MYGKPRPLSWSVLFQPGFVRLDLVRIPLFCDAESIFTEEHGTRLAEPLIVLREPSMEVQHVVLISFGT